MGELAVDLKLLPCPFCGGAPELEPVDQQEVRCMACGCQTNIEENTEDAVAAWNRRAPWKPEEIEALIFAKKLCEEVIESEEWYRHKITEASKARATLERMIEERS